MENDFNIIDKLLIIGMLNDYLVQCIQEQTYPQCVIDEMVKAKEKLCNLFAKIVITED